VTPGLRCWWQSKARMSPFLSLIVNNIISSILWEASQLFFQNLFTLGLWVTLFWRVNVPYSFLAHWKARCWLPITDETFLFPGVTAKALLRKIYWIKRRFCTNAVNLTHNLRYMRTLHTHHFYRAAWNAVAV